ncbi:MAG: sugar O-acetyltransferase [Saonia sp.]
MKKEKIYYQRDDKELKSKNTEAKKLTHEFNTLGPGDIEDKNRVIRKLFGKIGTNFTIEHNFQCDLGSNIAIGDNFYAGYNCVILDIAKVKIGNDCMMAPNVSVYTAGHALEPENRNKQGYAIPVHIGNNVWIGGGSVILPGVVVGDNSVIAAGSVVTKDVEPNTVVAGNPAKFLKHID